LDRDSSTLVASLLIIAAPVHAAVAICHCRGVSPPAAANSYAPRGVSGMLPVSWRLE
jgi:hypothetical protein